MPVSGNDTNNTPQRNLTLPRYQSSLSKVHLATVCHQTREALSLCHARQPTPRRVLLLVWRCVFVNCGRVGGGEERRFPNACQSGSEEQVRFELLLALATPFQWQQRERQRGPLRRLRRSLSYTTPLWPVQVTALSSFCRVLILSVSCASLTPSLIGSTLWVFHHGSIPFSRSVAWTLFALANLGLSACHKLCVRATRSRQTFWSSPFSQARISEQQRVPVNGSHHSNGAENSGGANFAVRRQNCS